MSQGILVVDDESSILTLIQYNLEKNGFQVTRAMDGRSAYERASNEDFDLIVLDIMLPEMDGLEVCKLLRQDKVATPILMVSAKGDELDKVLGLELGADDYMTKPFSPRELVARVRALLRRATSHEVAGDKGDSSHIKIGDIDIYPEKHDMYLRGKLVELTQKEYELLLYLAKHPDRVLSREKLLSAVWDIDIVGDTRVVDVHVSHLREKIEINTKKPEYIKTIHGIGYKLGHPILAD